VQRQAESVPQVAAGNNQASMNIFAGLFHVGMLAVAFSCAYTLQPPNYTKLYFVTIAALAVGVIIGLLVVGSRLAQTSAGRALTALMAGIAYSLAYQPQVAELLSSCDRELLPAIAEFAPSLGTIGLLVALLGAALYLLGGCDRRPANEPFSLAVMLAAGLVLTLGIIMYIALAPVYNLQGGMYTRLLVARGFEYGLLVLAVLRVTGGPGIATAPIWYMAAALLVAALRHILGIGMV